MKIEEGHTLILSTGRKIYTWEGRLSVGEKLLLASHSGYQIMEEGNFKEEPLTREEKKEIRDYVIDLWDKWVNA